MKISIYIGLVICVLFLACTSQESEHSQERNNANTMNKDSLQNIGNTLDEKQDISTPNERIEQIRTDFQSIESNLSSFRKVKQEIQEDAPDPSEFELYYKDNSLVKMKVALAYGHGAEVIEYYLKADKLFFVFVQEFEEASVMGPFTDRQYRIYYHNDEVIKVLKKEKTIEENIPIDFSKIENEEFTSSLPEGFIEEIETRFEKRRLLIQ